LFIREKESEEIFANLRDKTVAVITLSNNSTINWKWKVNRHSYEALNGLFRVTSNLPDQLITTIKQFKGQLPPVEKGTLTPIDEALKNIHFYQRRTKKTVINPKSITVRIPLVQEIPQKQPQQSQEGSQGLFQTVEELCQLLRGFRACLLLKDEEGFLPRCQKIIKIADYFSTMNIVFSCMIAPLIAHIQNEQAIIYPRMKYMKERTEQKITQKRGNLMNKFQEKFNPNG